MAEDIAREIIAQSRDGSKLAFSFQYGEALLYTSRGADKKILYHVHQRRNTSEQQYEFKYADLESAVQLVLILISDTNFQGQVVFYKNNGIDCEEVLPLGRLRSSNLMNFLEEKIKILDVVNVEAM